MYECMKMYEDLFPYHKNNFFFRVRFFYHTSSYIPTFVFVIRIYFFLYEECMKNSSYSLFVSLFVRKNRLFPSFFSCNKKKMAYLLNKKIAMSYGNQNLSLRLLKIENITEIEKEEVHGVEKRFRYSDRCSEFNTVTILPIRIGSLMFYIQTSQTQEEIREMSNVEFDKFRRLIYHKFFYYNILKKEKIQNRIEKLQKILRSISPSKG